jgi:hypothetical protein
MPGQFVSIRLFGVPVAPHCENTGRNQCQLHTDAVGDGFRQSIGINRFFYERITRAMACGLLVDRWFIAKCLKFIKYAKMPEVQESFHSVFYKTGRIPQL